MHKYIFIVIALLLFAGCRNDRMKEYIVYRDIEQNPTVTVAPLIYYYDRDVRFALDTERKLIQLGVNLLEMPPQHDEIMTVNKDKGKLEEEGNKSARESQGAMIEKRYTNLVDIKSTFIIVASADSETLKVIRKDGMQIVGIISYRAKNEDEDTRKTRSEILRGLVESLGIKTKSE